MSQYLSSKKFLRPPAPQQSEESDDEEELLDSASEEETGNNKVNANLSSSEDESENEEARNKKRRRSSAGNERKRPKASSFFDIEAEASDEEDEEDGARHKEGEHMDKEAEEIIRQQDLRRALAGTRFTERSAAEISREIEERHRMQGRKFDRSMIVDRPVRASVEDEEGVPEVYTAVAQQSLVPSVSDPSLWMVSCKTGKEKELVFQIMNKCISYARQGRPLGITAAIAAQSKGRVYIESFNEPAVVEAIQGIRGLLQYKMRLVPIGDMTTVMSVTSTKRPVKKDEWVRMMRGHYKGDLALVKSVKESGLKCVVQCIPRLDLTLADLPREEGQVRRRMVRPPQKFFNVQEIAALGRHSLRRQRFPGLDLFCDYFDGNFYYDGYLLKEMTVGSMVKPCTEDDPPTLEELQRFQRRRNDRDVYDDGGEQNEGSKLAASLLDELSELQGRTGLGRQAEGMGGGLLVGDMVEVIAGDLIGMRGKLVTIDSTTVKIKPISTSMELGGMDEIEFLTSQVRKSIPVGAHVKVTNGRYANETGVVVAVEPLEGETDYTAVVLTDVTSKEISVRTSQLRESAEVASGQDKLQGYELYDLVVLSGGGSANEVGVIVRVGREDFTVVNNHGIVRDVRPEELRGKRNLTSSRAVALDVQGNQIRVGDIVNVAEGPHRGKSATIKRLSNAQLFLHSQTRAEHAGIFVVRSRSCVLAGSRSQNRGTAGDVGASPFATPQSQSKGGLAASRSKRDDALIGKTVRIQAGQWKGLIGTVTDSTATDFQVELHSRPKKVMVVRERVTVIGDKYGATEVQTQAEPLAPNVAPMATPMHAIGGATPAIHGFGGATPAHDSEQSDEVWRPGGSIDQEAVAKDGWGADEKFPMKDDGWGGDSTSWGSSAVQVKVEQVKPEPYTGTAIKREQAKSEMDAEGAEGEDTPAWFMERVCVQLKYSSKEGVIKEVYPDKSALIQLTDKSVCTERFTELQIVRPKEHDTVLVTGGNEIGLEGSLVCVDGGDAILKDANDDFKIIDLVHLVKISSE